MIHVLVLDDESELREEVAFYLRARQCMVTEAGSIRECRNALVRQDFDILVIDRKLPDGDGLDLVSDLRAQGLRCGMVVFSARDACTDRIEGYQRLADHYLTKPVRLDELCAVVESLAWRVKGRPSWRLQHADWALHSPNGLAIKLTGQELAFLSALSESPLKVLSRQKLADKLGKDPSLYELRNMDALVLRLRKKVAELTPETLPVKTVHGSGYTLTQAIEVVL
jgi:two-component system OmpR family response regulator